MKFFYEYRTSDNVRHKGEIKAASREVAFDALRKKGIKPASLSVAPGILNVLLGRGKRWMVIFLLIIAVALSVVWGVNRDPAEPDWCDRRQLVGDIGIISQGVHCGWTNVFSRVGDLVLAAYAQPAAMPIQGMTINNRYPQFGDDLLACVHRPVPLEKADRPEHQQLKRIVNGMKREMDEYIRAGGNVVGYQRRLNKRLVAEKAKYDSIVHNYELATKDKTAEQIIDAWQNANADLRMWGFETLPFPAVEGR